MSYTHKLSKSFDFEGKSYDELIFDFDKLTGEDVLKAESEVRARGNFMPIPDTDADFQAVIAAKASGVGSDFIENLPMADFKAVTSKVRREITTKKSEKVAVLNIDFAGLKGKDLIEIDRMGKSGRLMSQPEFSLQYQMNLVAKAAGIDAKEIERWPIIDFTAATRMARLFLLINSQ